VVTELADIADWCTKVVKDRGVTYVAFWEL
jgi:hypothetical protein